MFLANWSESGLSGLKSDFEINDVGGEVLFAAYTYEDYEGDAFVLFQNDGKIFEVNGGHCSCYGLEGQWEPEETSKDALLKRLNGKAYGVMKIYNKEIRSVLNQLPA